jgi:hypothetical protein
MQTVLELNIGAGELLNAATINVSGRRPRRDLLPNRLASEVEQCTCKTKPLPQRLQ